MQTAVAHFTVTKTSHMCPEIVPPAMAWQTPNWARASSASRVRDHAQVRHTTLDRTPLDE